MKHEWKGFTLPNYARDSWGRTYAIHLLDDHEIEWLLDDFKKRLLAKVELQREQKEEKP